MILQIHGKQETGEQRETFCVVRNVVRGNMQIVFELVLYLMNFLCEFAERRVLMFLPCGGKYP